MPSNPIELRINGESQLDFKTARVTFSLDQMARNFSFALSDKWFQSGIKNFPFIEGDEVTVSIYGKTVIDGIIDDIPIDYDATSHNIGVSGRSRTGQLVDCSAVYKGGSWKDTKLVDIATALCEPFGITVKVDDHAKAEAQKPFKKWAIEDEETPYTCINRAAKMRGLFLISDAGRNLIITKASPTVFGYTLKLGQNIKRGRRSSRFRERYSEYIVKSQRAGDDTVFADTAGKGYFRATDPQVLNFRPLIIVSDGQGSTDELSTRGQWERNVRAGKSRRISYDHQGFRTPPGPGGRQLFPINQLIPVDDPFLDFRGNLLIVSASYSFGDSGGEIVTLELGAPEAYDVLLPPKKRAKKGGGSLW